MAIAPEDARRDPASLGMPALEPSAEVTIVRGAWDDGLCAAQPVPPWLEMRCHIFVRVVVYHE